MAGQRAEPAFSAKNLTARLPALEFAVDNPNACAGFAAGLTSTACLYPLEVVKTRFQIGNQQQYLSTRDALRRMWQTAGGREWYRGFGPGIVGSSLAWGQYFWLYSTIKEQYRKYSGANLSAPQYFLASFVSGCTVQLTLCPLWVVKLNQQVGTPGFASFFQGAGTLYQQEGLRGFYRGLVSGSWSSFQGGIQFVLYETFRGWRRAHHGLSDESHLLPVSETLAVTTAAKAGATLAMSPVEVVKAHMRNVGEGRQSVRECIGRVWRAEGMVGFYRGVPTALLRMLPAQWITFVTYEHTKSFLMQ